MIIRIFVLISLLLLTTPAIAQETNADEEAVWALEEDYWRFVTNKDIESYKALWDEQVIAWGDTSPYPSLSSQKWLTETPEIFAELFGDPDREWSYELRRRKVHSFGDVVAAHYWMRDIWTSSKTGEPIEEVYWKITHTWQRRGNTWQIISGMGSIIPPE